MFSIVSIVIFIMSVYLMNKMFIGFQPGSSRVNSDVNRFRAQADKWQDQLVPWKQEELGLVSLSERNKVAKKGFGRSSEGVIESIYHEPMLYYYYKEYPATSRNALMFVRTSRYEMVYRMKQKNTQVFVNEEHMGTLYPDGSLRSADGTHLGRIDRSDPYIRPIGLDSSQVGSVLFPSEEINIKPRAFDIDESMDDGQRLLFMILGIHEIVLHLSNARPNLPAVTS